MLQKIIILFSIVFSGIGLISAQEPTRKPPPNSTPFDHYIYIATSDDGLKWELDETLVRAHTSVPDIIAWQDTLWIYAVDGTNIPTQQMDKLVVLRLDVATGIWEEFDIVIEDFAGRPVDPDAVVLSDDELRLYFFDFSVNSPPPPPNSPPPTGYIYSATTTDGIHFVLDEGARLEHSPPVGDPDIVQLDDLWWLYTPRGADLLVYQSENGFDFTEADIINRVGMSSTVLREDGTLRQYYCATGGTHSHVSTDGLQWSEEEGLRWEGACGAAVEQLDDGTWVMVLVYIGELETTPTLDE